MKFCDFVPRSSRLEEEDMMTAEHSMLPPTDGTTG